MCIRDRFDTDELGTLVWSHQDPNWIPHASHNPYSKCKTQKNEMAMDKVDWTSRVNRVKLQYDHKNDVILYNGNPLPCNYGDGYCPPTCIPLPLYGNPKIIVFYFFHIPFMVK